MPQMSPIYWLLLMFFFIIFMMIIMTFIYFSFLKNPSMKMFKLLKQDKNWKW